MIAKSAIRVGILGAGSVSEFYHLPVLEQMPEVRLAWVCDQSAERAQAIAKTFNIPAAHTRIPDCADVDALLVAIPVGARRAALEAIALRGWNAFCEKPFAATSGEHVHLVDIARKHHIRVGVGLVRRHYVSTQAAQRLVASRALGEITRVLAGDGIWMRRTGRGADFYQADPAACGGGVFAETGSHLVDQMLTIVGARSHRLDRVRQEIVDGLELETAASGELDVGGRRPAPFTCVVTRLRDCATGISIRCERGEIRLALAPDSVVETYDLAGVPLGKVHAAPDARRSLFDAVRAEWRAFFDAMHGGAELTDWDTGLLTTRFIEDCYRAGRTSRTSTAPARAALEGGAV
jgi:predicted dehydrogenase